MQMWIFWLITSIVLIILELLSLSFFLLVFAIAALIGVVISLLGLNIYWQIFSVAFVALILIGFLPKFLKNNLLKSGRKQFIVGDNAHFIAEIVENPTGGWRVKYQGDTFPCKFYDASVEFDLAVGMKIKVVKFEGITALIEKL